MKRFDMIQTAKKFLKTHFPLSSSYHFLYGIWCCFLAFRGFALEPFFNAHRGLFVILALISIPSMILVLLFAKEKYWLGRGNWYALGVVTTLIVAACFGQLEIQLVLVVLVIGAGFVLLYKCTKNKLLF